jgi:bifunctional DNase/RNase
MIAPVPLLVLRILEVCPMIEMTVAGIALDAATRAPIVLLRDTTERRALPIWISQDQARAIMFALERQAPPPTLNPRLVSESPEPMGNDH